MILARECCRIEEYDTNGKPVVVTESFLPLENKNTRSVPNEVHVRHQAAGFGCIYVCTYVRLYEADI